METYIMKPTIEDVEALEALFESVIPHTFVKEGLPSDHEAVGEELISKKDQLKSYLEGDASFYFIWKENGQVLGTIWYGEANHLIEEGAKGALRGLGEVGTVFVLPEYQGRGIGGKLVAHMLKALKDSGIKECVLDSGYTHAQKVWIYKFGQPDYLMKDQWGEGYDHMIWKIKL